MRVCALTLWALVATSGCTNGVTCGRGRCDELSRCVSVFSDRTFEENGAWPDSSGFGENEWWCLYDDCPTDLGCGSSQCLQAPEDDQNWACVADETELFIRYHGDGVLVERTTSGCACSQTQVNFAEVPGRGLVGIGLRLSYGTIRPGDTLPATYQQRPGGVTGTLGCSIGMRPQNREAGTLTVGDVVPSVPVTLNFGGAGSCGAP